MSVLPLPARAFGLLAATLLFGCSETTVEVQLHSLQASGEVAFLCRTPSGEGIDRSQCPDYESLGYRIFALVTQTSTEEVAVIDTRAAVVVDVDPSAPGYSFLRVPSRPGDIASTPGGAATFVGLTGVGKTGITAIPTTCIGPPKSEESARDVTSFASCHLPTTPGDITVLVAPPVDGTVRENCEAGSPAEDENPSGARVSECQANLTREHLDPDGNVVGPIGRRKLAVALPDFGEIAIIDAQWLLDQTPGSFPECRVEATLALEVDLGPAGTQQSLDDTPELRPKTGCDIPQPLTPPAPPSYVPRPGGFAAAGDHLYVADRAAPVIHTLDVSNPCAPNELAPLLPMSFERPSRVVTTSRVAASPLTPDGKRWLYAIDELDQPAASIMAFDVSDGSTNRTPLVRPGSLYVPEPPDRLRLSTPIADVAFAFRDLPASDPSTGVAETGVRCDPDPRIDRNSAAAQHRPTNDRSRGAQPRLLRGLFGLAMLTSGHVAIIDVDDFDAPCRRHYTTNPENDDNFRGCSGDAGLPQYLTFGDGTDPRGAVTVTNEVSCNMVEPHRFRSATFGITSPSLGTGAPGLTAFPEFARPVAVDRPPQHQPKLLAVPFEPSSSDPVPPPPEVYIGSSLHTKGAVGADLPTDPNTSLLTSLTLPFAEPRTMPPTDNVVVTYEGPITGDFASGSIVPNLADPNPMGVPDRDYSDMLIQDPTAEFCDKGVYDRQMLREHGEEELAVAEEEARDVFAETHADIVEVTSDFLPLEDPYWNSDRLLGGQCGITRSVCVETFGNFDPPEVNENRELSVLKAYQDRLVVQASGAETVEERAALQTLFECCFPQGIQYRIRARKQWVLVGSASGLRNDVTAAPEEIVDLSGEEKVLYRCQRDCDPKKTFWNGRVFEISSEIDCQEGSQTCAVGLEEPGDPCVYDPCDLIDPGDGSPAFCQRDGSVRLVADDTGPADERAVSCIHSGLTARFAVYRGLSPSVRGMTFSWQTTGGFRALLTSIASVSVAVLPQNVQYVPEIQRIAIVDGASLGLSLVSIDSLRVEQPWPVY